MQIEHDNDEPAVDRGRGPWIWVIPVLLVVVAVNAYTGILDWLSFVGGLGCGVVLAAWAIEITGNKVPRSWRRKTPASRRS